MKKIACSIGYFAPISGRKEVSLKKSFPFKSDFAPSEKWTFKLAY